MGFSGLIGIELILAAALAIWASIAKQPSPIARAMVVFSGLVYLTAQARIVIPVGPVDYFHIVLALGSLGVATGAACVALTVRQCRAPSTADNASPGASWTERTQWSSSTLLFLATLLFVDAASTTLRRSIRLDDPQHWKIALLHLALVTSQVGLLAIWAAVAKMPSMPTRLLIASAGTEFGVWIVANPHETSSEKLIWALFIGATAIVAAALLLLCRCFGILLTHTAKQPGGITPLGERSHRQIGFFDVVLSIASIGAIAVFTGFIRSGSVLTHGLASLFIVLDQQSMTVNGAWCGLLAALAAWSALGKRYRAWPLIAMAVIPAGLLGLCHLMDRFEIEFDRGFIRMGPQDAMCMYLAELFLWCSLFVFRAQGYRLSCASRGGTECNEAGAGSAE